MKTFASASLSACTRRQALTLFAAGAGVAACGAELALAAPVAPSARPVMAYFRDGLLHDTSGRLPAWRAPRGHRGAGQVARLSEEARIRAGIVF